MEYTFLKYLLLNFFIFGCVVFSLLCELFSSCGGWGLLSNWGTQAFHCSGFSCGERALGRAGFSSCSFWAQSLQLLGSVVAASGLSSCSSWDLEPRLSRRGARA